MTHVYLYNYVCVYIYIYVEIYIYVNVCIYVILEFRVKGLELYFRYSEDYKGYEGLY